MKKRLSRKNAIYTGGSGTTTMINYDMTSHILEVQFIEGDVYHYLHVPPKVWKEYEVVVKTGGSSGTFVNKKIKPYYKYVKISED